MLIDAERLLMFVPAALALNLTPGADMLFCLGQGLRSGPRAGVAASFGVATGSLVHSLLAAFGLAALLAAHPIAFEVLRWLGVAYLVWLAVQAFRRPVAELGPKETSERSALLAWRDGVVVNLFNPKVALFVLAFIPQFVDVTKGSTVLQFLIFGAVLNVGGTTINALVGGFSGSLGRALTRSPRTAQALQRATGVVFLGLAARLGFGRA